MTPNELVTLLGGIIAAINAASLVYFAWKRLKPEVKKMEIDVESDIAELENLRMEGAKISAQMLLDRINELKGELDMERKLRKEGMAQAEAEFREKYESLEKRRRDDAEYFRRRIKDLERDNRDYKNWAAKLIKQVVEAGKIPVPFVPSYGDSDPSVTAIRVDLENDESEESK